MIERRKLPLRRQHERRGHFLEDITVGSVRLKTVNRTLYLASDTITLPPKLFVLLEYLMRHHSRVVSSSEIIQAVWPENPQGMTAGDVKQYIFLLRKRIEKDHQHPKFIKNIRGFGYQFDSNG